MPGSAASVKICRKLSTELSWKLAAIEWQWPSMTGMARRSKSGPLTTLPKTSLSVNIYHYGWAYTTLPTLYDMRTSRISSLSSVPPCLRSRRRDGVKASPGARSRDGAANSSITLSKHLAYRDRRVLKKIGSRLPYCVHQEDCSSGWTEVDGPIGRGLSHVTSDSG